ncbi:hypothetical protein BH11VER1_BH11VER1_38150 [soil metagenome]
MKHIATLAPRRPVLPGILVAFFLILGSACAITYPPASSLLYGNSSVNQVGQSALVAGSGLPYRYLPPKNYNPAVKYPVIIFLHGQGEKGTNNTAQLGNNANGAMALVSTANPDNQTNYPCFFVAPQAPVSSGWSNVATQLQDILNTLSQYYSIDPDRICLTGLSMGALSSWSIVSDMPNTFSSLVPQSGGGGSIVLTMPKIPVWAFHAENDSTVVCNGTDNSVADLRKRGFPVIYTRYNTGGHGIWTTAYQHPQLAAWIAAQRRGESMQGLPSVTISNATLGLSPLKLTGTAATNSGLNISRVGWCNSTNGGSPGALDGVTNGTTTFSSASAAFTAAGLASYRIAIRKAIASTTSSFYYDVMSVQDAQTLILDRTSTAETARSYTLYKPGGYNLLNPATGTGSASWDTWSVDVPLSSGGGGVNIAHVFAEMPSGSGSLGGRTSINQSLTVTYAVPAGDTTPPTLAITSPASSPFSTASSTVAISGTASDAVGVTAVTWSSDRGSSGTATGTNAWSIPNVSLAVGLNVITVTAKDAKNNTASSVLTVNCTGAGTDTTLPAITITAPTSNAVYTTSNNTIDLSGTASDNVGVSSVTWSNSATASSGSGVGTTSWTANGIALNPGMNSITMTASDAAGNIATDTIDVTRAINQAPTVNAGNDQTISLPASASLTGGVSDDGLPSGSSLTTAWTKLSGPGTVSFGSTSALSTTAGFSAAGTYVLRLTASDGTLVTTDDATFIVNTSTAVSSLLSFDFGATGTVTSPNWNNVTDITTGEKISNAVNSDGGSTGIKLNITGAFLAINSAGTASPTVPYPASATLDTFYVQNAGVGKVRLEGLNVNAKYTLTFFASRMNSDASNRVTAYTAGGSTVTLNVAENISNRVSLSSVSPAADGTLEIQVSNSTGSGYGYLGVLEVQVIPISAFQTWKTAQFGVNASNPAIAGDTVDYDKDGIANLAEYALSGNPNIPSANIQPTLSVSANRLQLSFTRLAPTDVTYIVEASTTLIGWTPIATLAANSTAWTGAAVVTETGSGATRNVTVQDTVTMSGVNSRFLRLRITSP